MHNFFWLYSKGVSILEYYANDMIAINNTFGRAYIM